MTLQAAVSLSLLALLTLSTIEVPYIGHDSKKFKKK